MFFFSTLKITKVNCTNVNNTTITREVHIGLPSWCSCLHPRRTRVPCRHVLITYIEELQQVVPATELHPRWYATHGSTAAAPADNCLVQKSPALAPIDGDRVLDFTSLNKHLLQLPQDLCDSVMRQFEEAAIYARENRTLPSFVKNTRHDITTPSALTTFDASAAADMTRLVFPKRQGRGRPRDSKRIRAQDEPKRKLKPAAPGRKRIKRKPQKSPTAPAIVNDPKEENEIVTVDLTVDPPVKAPILTLLPPLPEPDSENLNIRIRNGVIAIKNPRSDGNCGFRCVAMAVFGDEERWGTVRKSMLHELTKNLCAYKNLGIDTNDLSTCLNDVSSPCKPSSWFSMPDCGIVAAGAFRRPVAIYGSEDSISSFYLPYTTPYSALKPIIMHWHGSAHFVSLSINNRADITYPPIEPQFCHHLGGFPDRAAWYNAYSSKC